jgi:hypothetical protein
MRAKQTLRGGEIALFSALTLTAVTAVGCIAVGGTDNYTQPTLGRQLQDLKVARDTGAVSDTEYADAKTKLINGEYLRKK